MNKILIIIMLIILKYQYNLNELLLTHGFNLIDILNLIDYNLINDISNIYFPYLTLNIYYFEYLVLNKLIEMKKIFNQRLFNNRSNKNYIKYFSNYCKFLE